MRLIISYLTFPGVIVHEFAHAWACRRLGIPIVKVCYLRLGNPLGYVLHERPEHTMHHVIVATAPLLVSTVIALAMSLLASLLVIWRPVPDVNDIAVAVAAWLSFSIALHAFPSSGDADALWDDVRSPDVSLLAKLLLVPVVGLIRLSGAGAAIWLDALFAIAVIALPPVLLTTIMG